MSQMLQIRPVEPRDFAAWLPLWDGYNAFYGRSGDTALPDAVTQITWARFFDVDEPVHALVAERDGVLLGLAHFLFHRSTTAIKPICYMQDLFTDPALRGQGIGRTLIEAVAVRAKEAQAARFYWHTRNTNHTAMRLYDQVATQPGSVVYLMDV